MSHFSWLRRTWDSQKFLIGQSLRSLFSKTISSITLFSYFSMIMVSSGWGGHPNEDWGLLDFRLKVTHQSRLIYPYGDSQRERGLDLEFSRFYKGVDNHPRTLFQAFIPFNQPFKHSNSKHFQPIMISAEVDKSNSSSEPHLIGVEWMNEYVKDLRVFLLWDGSIIIKGKKSENSQPQKLFVMTPGGIALRDVNIRFGHFETSQFEVSGQVKIPYLTVKFPDSSGFMKIARRGQLSTKVLNVPKGQLIDEGDILGFSSSPLEMRVEDFHLAPEGALQGDDLSLWFTKTKIAGFLYSKKHLMLSVEKEGKFFPSSYLCAQHLFLNVQGIFTQSLQQDERENFNVGHIYLKGSRGTFLNETPLMIPLRLLDPLMKLINRSVLTLGGSVFIRELLNDTMGIMKLSHIYGVDKLHNNGVIDADTIEFNPSGEGLNKGTISFANILGQGSFTNQGHLKAKGSLDHSSQIDIQAFDNESLDDDSRSGSIEGNALVFGNSLASWSNKGGHINVSYLGLLSNNEATHFLNEGDIRSQQLYLRAGSLINKARLETDNFNTLQNSRLFTSGLFLVKDQANGDHLDVLNEGILHLQGLTCFKKGTFHNKGFLKVGTLHKDPSSEDIPSHEFPNFTNDDYAEFEGLITTFALKNTKDLIAHRGIMFVELDNTGSADIKYLLGAVKSFKNTGELSLTNAMIYSDLPLLVNQGTFVLNNAVDINKTLHIQNHKVLVVDGLTQVESENQLSFKGITNADEAAEVHINTPLDLEILNNRGKIFFKTSAMSQSLDNKGTLFFHNPSSNNCLIINEAIAFQGTGEEEGGSEIKIYSPQDTLNQFSITGTVEDWGQIDVTGNVEFIDKTLPAQKLKASGFIRPAFMHEEHQDLTVKDLGTYHSQVSGMLDLRARNFICDEDVEVESLGLRLHLQGMFKVQSSLKLKELHVLAEGDFVGGITNEVMGKIVASDGPLNLVAKSIDARFSKLYSKGPLCLHATHGNISSGAVKLTSAVFPYYIGIARGYVNQYQRHDRNDSYLASNDLIELNAPQGQILLDYCTLFSPESITLKAHPATGTIGGITPSIQGKSLVFHGQSFVSDAPTQHYINGPSGNSNYPEVYYYLERGIPGLIQGSEDITFHTPTVKLVGGGSLLAGRNIYANDRLVLGGQKAYGSEFTTITRTEKTQSRNKGYGWGNINYLKTHAPLIQAGQQIHLNLGHVQLSGTQNAPVVTIVANTASLSNPARAREDQIPTALSIDLVEYYKQIMSHGGGFIKQLTDQSITTDQPLAGGLVPSSSQMLFFDHMQHHTSIPRFLIDPSPLEFILQHALSQHAGQLNLEGLSGRHLMEQLYHNAHHFRQDHGMITNPQLDVETFQKAMIAYKAHEIAGQIAYAAQLLLPSRLINRFKQIGDISGNDISISTDSDQLHSANRVIAQRSLQIFAGGSLRRETPKYVDRTHHIRKTIEKEVAGPQQVMGSMDGNATITSQGHYTETAALSFAGQDLVRGSLAGDTRIHHLDLKTTVNEQSNKRSGLSHKTTTTTTTNTSHQHIPSIAIAGRDSKIIGDQIEVTGSEDRAHRDLRYEGGEVRLEAALSVNQQQQSQKTSTPLGSSAHQSLTQTPTFTAARAQAGRNMYFNASKATLKGAQLQADTVVNNTRASFSVHPKIVALCQSITQSNSSNNLQSPQGP